MRTVLLAKIIAPSRMEHAKIQLKQLALGKGAASDKGSHSIGLPVKLPPHCFLRCGVNFFMPTIYERLLYTVKWVLMFLRFVRVAS